MFFITFSFFLLILCFFFKQKTAYEMRISDWSSDVCSSDLSQEKLSGSDFINQYCCAAMLFPFRWGARTVKGITSAENGSFRALQISRATFIGRAHKRSPSVSNDSGSGAGAVYEAWRDDRFRRQSGAVL